MGLQLVAAEPHEGQRRIGARRPAWHRWMLIGAPVVFLAVFFGYPVVKILSLSFTVDDALSLGNYRWFFDNPVNLEVMRRRSRRPRSSPPSASSSPIRMPTS